MSLPLLRLFLADVGLNVIVDLIGRLYIHQKAKESRDVNLEKCNQSRPIKEVKESYLSLHCLETSGAPVLELVLGLLLPEDLLHLGLLLSLLLLLQLLELDLGLRKSQSLGRLMLLYLEHCCSQKLRFRSL